jgi:hypothetical protein
MNVEVFGSTFEAAAAIRRAPHRYSGLVFVNDNDLRVLQYAGRSPSQGPQTASQQREQDRRGELAVYAVTTLTDLSTNSTHAHGGTDSSHYFPPGAVPTDDEIHCSDRVLTVRIVVFGFAGNDTPGSSSDYKSLYQSFYVPHHQQHTHQNHPVQPDVDDSSHFHQEDQTSKDHGHSENDWNRQTFLERIGVWRTLAEPLEKRAVKASTFVFVTIP